MAESLASIASIAAAASTARLVRAGRVEVGVPASAFQDEPGAARDLSLRRLVVAFRALTQRILFDRLLGLPLVPAVRTRVLVRGHGESTPRVVERGMALVATCQGDCQRPATEVVRPRATLAAR